MKIATIVLALAVFVALSTIFVVRSRNRSAPRLVLLMVISTLCLLIGFRGLTEALDFYPDTGALSLAKGTAGQLKRAAQDPGIERILLIEGGSYSARGVDGAMLARLLSRGSGARTAVVQLTMPGSNHFERSWLLEKAVSDLTDAELVELERKQLTLLMEIHKGYDMSPLQGFMSNRGSDRTYSYMTLGNAFDGLRAVRSLGVETGERLRDVAPAVLSHALVNTFAVGLAPRMVSFDQVKPSAGYQPLRKSNSRFPFGSGMRGVLERIRSRPASHRAAGAASLEWIEDIRLKRYLDRLPGLVDRQAFYGVPSRHVGALVYVESFCAARPQSTCISYGDPGLIKRLNRPMYWYDLGHMRSAGARRFTRWFSKRYTREMDKAGLS